MPLLLLTLKILYLPDVEYIPPARIPAHVIGGDTNVSWGTARRARDFAVFLPKDLCTTQIYVLTIQTYAHWPSGFPTVEEMHNEEGSSCASDTGDDFLD